MNAVRKAIAVSIVSRNHREASRPRLERSESPHDGDPDDIIILCRNGADVSVFWLCSDFDALSLLIRFPEEVTM